MRKLLLLCATAGIISTAHADHHLGNIYVGPFIGMGVTEGKFKMNDNDAFHNKRIGDKGFLGGLLLGYAYPCKNLFMGFELLGNFDTTKDTIINEGTVSTGRNESFKLKNRASYGFSARLGYRTHSDTVFFVRLGGEWSHYKLSYAASSVNPAGELSASNSKTKFAFVPGIGIEAPIDGRWRVRLEGKYRLPQKVSFTTGSSTAGFTYEDSHVRARTSQTSVIIGATYSF